MASRAYVLRPADHADVISPYRPDRESGSSISEELCQELQSLGLIAKEARVLIHLTLYGPLKARDVAQALGIHKTEVYHTLTSLQSKGLVLTTFQHPMKFAAVSFDKALSTLIGLQRQRLMVIESRKHELSGLWKSLPKNSLEKEKEAFQVIEGVNQVCLKMGEMIRAAEKTINMVAHDQDLQYIYRYGVFERLKGALRKNMTPRIVSNNSAKSAAFLKDLKGAKTRLLHVINEFSFLPHFLITDDREVLLLVKNFGVDKRHFSALWTNYNAFVCTMNIFFSKLWESDRLENAPVLTALV
ncbi:MAG: TrmB family transcriptional regulator [Candidatus Bathyarchaeia archaeon]